MHALLGDGPFLHMLATLAVGGVGAFVAKKIRMPAPFMTGAMFAVMIFNLFTGSAYMPYSVRLLSQTIAGGAIGVSIRRDTLAGLKTITKPVCVYIVLMMGIAFVASAVVYRLTSLSLATSVLSCSPGGFTDMTLLSYDFGGNPIQVSILHLMRVIIGVGIFPLFTQAYLRRHGDAAIPGEPLSAQSNSSAAPISWRDVASNVLIMFAGGLTGYWLGVPAGAITFSMVSVAIYQVKTNKARMSLKVRRCAQILAGSLIGSTMTVTELAGLRALLFPFILIFLEFFIINFVVGPFVARRYKLDMTTILLACSPAGVTDMALLAGEMGGDQAKVALFHIIRLASVLIIFPMVMVALA